MKLTKGTVITGLILGALLFFGGIWLKVNYFEAGATFATKWQDVDAAMRLSVQGEDLRVYEFTPQTAPHLVCIFVAGTNKASLECDPKRDSVSTPAPIALEEALR